MKTKNIKKTPADYPQMIFRITQEDKERISFLVERITLAINKALPPKSKKFRKNDVIVDALFLGLLSLERKYSRRKD